ncbi:MAG: tRNA uridine-5-carboxymethylaminomethyl(34) synthesis GTPase MnmE [Thermodesulfobacteriota bacterium]
MDDTTIAAVATPSGYGGIGIIKISGPRALPAMASLFCSGPPAPSNAGAAAASPEMFQSWRMYYGHIRDPRTGRFYDEVVVAVMRAPHSYTREDVAEIQAHAGPVVLNAILELLTSRGIRLAEPGEFTRRAFVNGRIDLTRAEAVMDVINAQSEAGLDIALQQLGGGLVSVISDIQAALVNVLSEIDACIDFPETLEDQAVDGPRLAADIDRFVCRPVADLIARHDTENFLREGLRVAIVGQPNVGKSSLMNCLLQADRAIVTDVPGTTRDLIEAAFYAEGIPVILADTAGLRSDPDRVEQLGIDKAWQYIDTADLVLFVVDAGQPVQAENIGLFEKMAAKPKILVINKSDLPPEQQVFQMPQDWKGIHWLKVSALYATGMDEVKSTIKEVADRMSGQSFDRLVPNLRHKTLLERCRRAVAAAMENLWDNSAPEIVSIDLREAFEALGEITGERVAPDVLDQIFNRYCVGK